MNWQEHKKELLKDPEFAREYQALEPQYRLAAALIRLRRSRGLTQEQLAKLVNTKQESIARLESARSLPSLSMLQRVAGALGAEIEINLKPREEISLNPGIALEREMAGAVREEPPRYPASRK